MDINEKLDIIILLQCQAYAYDPMARECIMVKQGQIRGGVQGVHEPPLASQSPLIGLAT